jgi:hypothetical protein
LLITIKMKFQMFNKDFNNNFNSICVIYWGSLHTLSNIVTAQNVSNVLKKLSFNGIKCNSTLYCFKDANSQQYQNLMTENTKFYQFKMPILISIPILMVSSNGQVVIRAQFCFINPTFKKLNYILQVLFLLFSLAINN